MQANYTPDTGVRGVFTPISPDMIQRAKVAAWLHRNFRRHPGGDHADYFDDLFRRYTAPLKIKGGQP